jgi:hypothetical protein
MFVYYGSPDPVALEGKVVLSKVAFIVFFVGILVAAVFGVVNMRSMLFRIPLLLGIAGALVHAGLEYGLGVPLILLVMIAIIFPLMLYALLRVETWRRNRFSVLLGVPPTAPRISLVDVYCLLTFGRFSNKETQNERSHHL